MLIRKTYVNTILVYLLFFVSGSMLCRQSPDRNLILVFFASLIAWAWFTDRKINDSFVLYASIFSGFLLVISLYTGGSLSIVSVISATMKLVLAYLILKTVKTGFVDTFVRVIVFLAVVSLFGYMSDIFYLFEGIVRRLPRVGDVGHEGIFYLFRYKYAGYDRNNSIFFEPGAYQGFLNAAIFMLLFARLEISGSRRWLYVLVLVVTLYTTFSTTGFLIFAAMSGLFLLKGKLLSAFGKLGIIGILLVILAVFSAQFEQVIVEKISKSAQIQDITDSSGGRRRSFDTLVDLEIFKKRVFGAGYDEYFELFGEIGMKSLAGSGSSNGITKMLAVFGLPFSIFYLASLYWALRKLLGGLLISSLAFGMVLMFFIGEAYYVFSPIIMAIIAAPFVYDSLSRDQEKEYQAEIPY